MHLYGLIIGIAILIGSNYFEKHQTTIPKDKVFLFELGLLVFALVGARAYHVIDQWSFYSQNPWLIPQTWNGGLGIFGAFFGSLLFITLFINHKSYITLLDSITPILPLCQAIGRLGNWINQENPVWWPEAISNLVLFALIRQFPSHPTAKYLAGYGLIRLITEFWRHDTWQINSIKIGQVISIMFILLGIFIFLYERRQIRHHHSQKHTLDS
jgi:phosphatidylglycerol:prolipoprotein diacylglycerol transferase